MSVKTNSEHLERKFNHLITLGEMVCSQYRDITCTERSALLLAFAAAVKQVGSNIELVREALKTYIIDPYGLDYVGYCNKIKALTARLETEIAGVPMVHNIDIMHKPVVGTTQIIEAEDKLFAMHEVDSTHRINIARKELIDGSFELYCNIICDLEILADNLQGMDNDYYSLRKNNRKLQEVYQNMFDLYRVENESVVQEDAGFLLDQYFNKYGKCRKAVQKCIDSLVREADAQTFEYIEGHDPALAILQSRSHLSMFDLSVHFGNVIKYDWLTGMLDRVDDMPPEEDCIALLHRLLEGKKGRVAAIYVQAAIVSGRMVFLSYEQFCAEFGKDIIKHTMYYQLLGPDNHAIKDSELRPIIDQYFKTNSRNL